MTRERDDQVFVLASFLAVIAAGAIVISMQVPPSDDVVMGFVGAARFVVAVVAGIFGFIAWFERRHPVGDDEVIDLRGEAVELDVVTRRR